jgi:radical SAM superfamily enzyme YgiQ (UPF0313 family)
MSTSFASVGEIIRCSREHKPDAPVVIGGALPSAHPEYVMSKLRPDFMVLGEGENTICELLSVLSEKDRDYREVPGLAFSGQNGELCFSPVRELIRDLDSLPFPDWEAFGLEYYLSHKLFAMKSHTADKGARCFFVIGSRGCVADCSFCYRVMGNKKYRVRSTDNVVEEVKLLQSIYGIQDIFFCDDLFACSKKRIREFCALIGKVGISWGCALRVDSVDEELLFLLRQAGCRHIGYGLESYSSKILQSMNKKIKPGQIESALRLTRQAGILASGNFIFGDPAETMETALETLSFYRRMRSFYINLDLIKPYPGTKIFKKLESEGKIQDMEHFYKGGMCVNRQKDGSLINMTSLSDEDFKRLETQIIIRRLTDSVYASVQEASEFKENIYDIKAVCPICGNRSVFEKIKIQTVVGECVTCEKCFQRFVISKQVFPQNKKLFNEYRQKLSELKNNKVPVVVTPCLRREFFEELYQRDFCGLNIRFFMDARKELDGSNYAGFPVLQRTGQNCNNQADCVFIVLRGFDFGMGIPEQICRELNSYGIEKTRILVGLGQFELDEFVVPEKDMVCKDVR